MFHQNIVKKMALKQKTITWDEELIKFVEGPLFEKTRVKFAQVSQLAMENHIKALGIWDEYLKFQAENIL